MSAVGLALDRVDGRAKVTGRARYAAEFDVKHLAHAAIATSTIAKGRIVAIDASAAERLPGILAILTHANAPKLPYKRMKERPQVDPKSGDQLRVLQGPEILFSGQPIALVVAETLEQARAGAALLRFTYDSAAAMTCFAEAQRRPPSRETAKTRPAETARGDADQALATAPVKIDQLYVQAREHHNAMEPHATIAVWEGERLTLYDKTQWVGNDRSEIAHIFGIPESHIRVISPFVGGAFGSALRTWPHVTLAALGAQAAARPVSLELDRRQLYSAIGFRPHTEQRVALGATSDGKLLALVQEATQQTSTYEEYAETVLEPPRMAYSCTNLRTRYRLLEMNTNSPCPMRAPGIATGLVALEMAMDELAAALHMDPVALRLKNHAEHDEHKQLPWSSKELRACYETAAARFGWARRPLEPRALRDKRDLVGYGMATALYPAHRAAASAAVRLLADGSLLLRSATSDMGPGTYTAMIQVAADALAMPPAAIRFELGDTDLPPAPVHGGSITMASVGSAVQAGCEALLAKLRQLASGMQADAAHGMEDYASLLRRAGLDHVEAEGEAAPGKEEHAFSSYAFGAIFAEVRVDAEFGIIRVPRLVGAYDVGRVVNPKIAHSQCIGGMVGGIGMALLEQAEWDPRFGRVMNANLAEYLVPVNADAGLLDAVFVPSDDRVFNPLGVKGVAELGLCGVAPAIANAVWHATGKRVRDLPILPEALLG
jgi:xanthine dehydrogenase YagR molybdenum-binding subunit